MKVLILRFQGPLMSFGAPIVDQEGEIQPYPARSMIAGLCANALGYDHSEFDRLERLQERISHASRCDCRGQKIQDFQRVDLGQDFMKDDWAWTTRGSLEERGGGSSEGLHLRHRDYWADAVHTIVLALDKPAEEPTFNQLTQAFKKPERPLFIGRKTCLPGGPLYRGTLNATSLLNALRKAPIEPGSQTLDSTVEREAWWPVDGPEGGPDDGMVKPVTDRRDWANQIHTGERWLAQETITLESEALKNERT